MPALQFPPGFLWGTATASYQIEGATGEDGRGESIWDRFSHTPGKVAHGHTGDVACDHYHRYREDIRLMQQLGLKAYRFSVAWPRIYPEGRGALNEAGLDFYMRLVDTILEAGITPVVTLYHWDLPQALQYSGGWASRDTAYYFAEYAATIARRLGDRVSLWITHNEPWVAAFVGHYEGRHAPGLQDLGTAVQAAHHLLLSHGLATQAIRTLDSDCEVGITLNLSPVHPANPESEADQAAARREDGYLNRWFLDALLRGAYPEDMLKLYAPQAPLMQGGDLDLISQPLDFLGVNNYFREVVQDDPAGDFRRLRTISPPGGEYTTMGWEVYPPGIYELLTRLHTEYKVPKLYITENGAAFTDTLEAPAEGGRVHDPRRQAYLQSHFAQAHRAIQEGAPLQGYFVWTLMDNFEWAQGYTQRFGVVYTDFATQRRIIKDSGLWYAGVVRDNAVPV